MRISDWSSDVCSSDLVDRAVAAAADAFAGWAAASPEVRADLLHRIGEALFARSAEIGHLLAREDGKTRAAGVRTEAGPVGPECVSTCRYRAAAFQSKQNRNQHENKTSLTEPPPSQ